MGFETTCREISCCFGGAEWQDGRDSVIDAEWEDCGWVLLLVQYGRIGAVLLLVQNGKIADGFAAMAVERRRWLLGADHLVRAARHYEGAAQILIRHAVMSARQVCTETCLQKCY